MPTFWDLLRRMPPLRWVAIQAGLAALLAALARAPRLGRPRPDPPSGADRPAEHALALGTLLARARRPPRPSSCSIATGAGDILERLGLTAAFAIFPSGRRASNRRRGGCLAHCKLEFQSEGDS